MSNSESHAINDDITFGEGRFHDLSEEEFERRLSDAAKQNISNDELDIFWRTEIYGRDVMRRTLMLDKWVKDKFSEANIAMIHFIKYVLKMKEDNIYQQIGYSKFEDWIQNHGISMSTVNNWQKIYEVFIKCHGFTPEELSMYDIKKLNIILPLAEMETVTKERVEELFELILFMGESDLRLSVKEEIALTLSEVANNSQN
ncbi:hypothetical protein E3V36_06980 [Candidatus Marinimicrobia bacterium MT.SAG.2]|nr:hypothetical protein E3V36_06980 [Candidatus Marinimicrobia bacterium MT.SAG.2]